MKAFTINLIEHVAKFINGAFSLICALAWNSAIQKSFEHVKGVGGQYLYAVLMTLFACAVIIGLEWLEKHLKKGVERVDNKLNLKPFL
jgi:hypothetical protein